MFLAGLFAVYCSAVPTAAAETYAMADAGVTINLPASWEMTRWSDWDYTAKSDSGLALKVWETPWQLELDERFKADVVKVYTDDLESQRGGDISVAVGSPAALGAVQALPTTVHFKFDRNGTPGVAYAEAIAVDGKMLHVVVYAAASNGARAKNVVESLVSAMTVQAPAAATAALGGIQKTTLGYSVTLPAGWRTPLATEKAEVSALASAAAITKPDLCFAAAHPGLANVQVMLLCEADMLLAIVDEYSFDGESEKLKNAMFGKAAGKLAKPTSIAAKDRMGIVFAPEINDHDLRLGVMPYDRGQAMAWFIGPTGSGPELEGVAKTTLSGLTYEGANGGLPPFGPAEQVVHILTYRPFHPAVLLCVGFSLLCFGGLVAFIFRPRKKHDEHPAY